MSVLLDESLTWITAMRVSADLAGGPGPLLAAAMVVGVRQVLKSYDGAEPFTWPSCLSHSVAVGGPAIRSWRVFATT